VSGDLKGASSEHTLRKVFFGGAIFWLNLSRSAKASSAVLGLADPACAALLAALVDAGSPERRK
jgi:hypothetical protein